MRSPSYCVGHSHAIALIEGQKYMSWASITPCSTINFESSLIVLSTIRHAQLAAIRHNLELATVSCSWAMWSKAHEFQEFWPVIWLMNLPCKPQFILVWEAYMSVCTGYKLLWRIIGIHSLAAGAKNARDCVCFCLSDSHAVTALLRVADSTFLFFSLLSHKHCDSSPGLGRRPTKCQEQRSKLEQNASTESHAWSLPRTRVHCEHVHSVSTEYLKQTISVTIIQCR